MIKTITIAFLLAGILAFSANTLAQEKTKPHVHVHDHSGHEQQEVEPHDHDHTHDHSGHSMSQSSGVAVDHESEHSAIPDHGHDHAIDHSAHDAQATEHGDLHHHHHMDHDHIMDHEGTMIMGQNLDKLPSSCKNCLFDLLPFGYDQVNKEPYQQSVQHIEQ